MRITDEVISLGNSENALLLRPETDCAHGPIKITVLLQDESSSYETLYKRTYTSSNNYVILDKSTLSAGISIRVAKRWMVTEHFEHKPATVFYLDSQEQHAELSIIDESYDHLNENSPVSKGIPDILLVDSLKLPAAIQDDTIILDLEKLLLLKTTPVRKPKRNLLQAQPDNDDTITNNLHNFYTGFFTPIAFIVAVSSETLWVFSEFGRIKQKISSHELILLRGFSYAGSLGITLLQEPFYWAGYFLQQYIRQLIAQRAAYDIEEASGGVVAETPAVIALSEVVTEK